MQPLKHAMGKDKCSAKRMVEVTCPRTRSVVRFLTHTYSNILLIATIEVSVLRSLWCLVVQPERNDHINEKNVAYR